MHLFFIRATASNLAVDFDFELNPLHPLLHHIMGPYSKLCFTLACLLCLVGSSYANNAIYVNTDTQNGKHVQLAITQWGSDWYFSICSVMGATCLGIIAASYRKPRTDRVFFYLCSAICGVATIAYFAMGSNLGWTPIDVEWRRTGPAWAGMHGINREIFYARYIDWYYVTARIFALAYC